MGIIPCKPVTFGGSTEPRSTYSKFRQAIKKGHKEEHFKDEGSLTVQIALYLESKRIRKGRNDLDYFPKPIIDALQEANFLEKHHIAKIIIERHSVDNDTDEGVDVKVNMYV
jgi:Holliday junction resolvase RusA-like endonuclease